MEGVARQLRVRAPALSQTHVRAACGQVGAGAGRWVRPARAGGGARGGRLGGAERSSRHHPRQPGGELRAAGLPSAARQLQVRGVQGARPCDREAQRQVVGLDGGGGGGGGGWRRDEPQAHALQDQAAQLRKVRGGDCQRLHVHRGTRGAAVQGDMQAARAARQVHHAAAHPRPGLRAQPHLQGKPAGLARPSHSHRQRPHAGGPSSGGVRCLG
mmetsp:Transcript_47322/g.90341  ORF Transcript_47322/g.90341 Transcript_47322/m.90341 type:complete len:214 (+) Transcript_47322:485-1126(+)